jgi:hypothetical protein
MLIGFSEPHIVAGGLSGDTDILVKPRAKLTVRHNLFGF